MNLAHLDLAGGSGPPAVLLHREAATAAQGSLEALRQGGVAGRVVVAYGGYAYYPSGMEAGGVCWYRVLPGYDGTDPISLATAVVQVGDLLDDLDLERALVVGFGQGAVVAVGCGLLRPDRVGWVVGVDPWPGHLPLLPPAPGALEPRRAAGGDEGRPAVLVAGSTSLAAAAVGACAATLAERGVAAATWCPPSEPGDPAAADAAALGGALRRWWRAEP